LILLWCARVTWALLPVTAGSALADATVSWSTAPARTAAVILWLVWATGLLALFAPRPVGLTFLRLAAPCGFLCVVLSLTSASTGSAALAIVGSGIAAILALSAPIAMAAANALAYGDEERFALRIPMPLLLGPVPIAVVLAGFGIATGPLLLADERYVGGVVATIVGFFVTFLIARAMHPMSCRWLVLVPAGIAIADPLTLTEPVLVRREHIESLRRTTSTAMPASALDLRLGTIAGGVRMELSERVEFGRRRGRADAEILATQLVTVAVVRADAAIAQARTRRINA
jgi:hypothetical protein